jgi:hypothetical protein
MRRLRAAAFLAWAISGLRDAKKLLLLQLHPLPRRVAQHHVKPAALKHLGEVQVPVEQGVLIPQGRHGVHQESLSGSARPSRTSRHRPSVGALSAKAPGLCLGQRKAAHQASAMRRWRRQAGLWIKAS